jgi:lysophospholipase L1-like esterase
LHIYGGTIVPNTGLTGAKEDAREAVNEWIRTSGRFDGVVDFDQAVRQPDLPHDLQTAFDSGDKLHPNDAGYKAMAQAVNLSWFR